MFKHHLLHTQDWCIPIENEIKETCMHEEGASGRSQMEKEVQSMGKKGLATQEEYGNIARVCRDGTRKSNAHLEWNLAKDLKDN